MTGAADLNDAIAQIYEAAVEADGLDRIAGIVAQALGSHSGLLGVLARPTDGQRRTPEVVGLPSATANFDDWARNAYAEHYHACNIWFERGVRKGFPAIVLSQELVTPDELVRSEWYDYCQRLDTFHVIGAQFHVDRKFSGQFGAQRPRRSKAFDEASRRRMSLLLPHLQRAMQIQFRLGLVDQLRAVTLDLLERVGVAVLLLDETRRVLFANSLAEHILERRSGLHMNRGRLSAAPPSADAFDRLVTKAARTSAGRGLHSGGMLSINCADGKSTRIFISPLPRDRLPCGTAAPAVLILASDSAVARQLSAAQLREAFGLTRAEGEVLAALVAGENPSDYADRHNLSIDTVRTHLKRVLNKTGYHRQVDLVGSVASDVLLRLNDLASETRPPA